MKCVTESIKIKPFEYLIILFTHNHDFIILCSRRIEKATKIDVEQEENMILVEYL
jgi:hypothetical protein